MKDLKDYRQREQAMYVIANALLFLVVHNLIEIKANMLTDIDRILSQLFSSTVFSVIAFGFIFVVECLFTSNAKEKLLYLFGLLSLPGCTIFSDVKKNNKDERFSYQSLADKHPTIYSNLPEDKKLRKKYENEQWYLIYSKIRAAPMIHSSQRDSLMCRDIFISTMVMLIIYIIVVVVCLVSFNVGYMLFLIAMLIITNIGANRKAVRFAYNVIAYDVSTPTRGGDKE